MQQQQQNVDVVPQQQQVQQQAQQLSDTSAATSEQAAPAKQAIYYYDPKDTTLSQNGDVLSLPKIVYDGNGKAHSLADLNQAPIFVQPPMMGATAASATNVAAATTTTGGATTVDMPAATSTGGADNLGMQAAPAREAVKIPKWGSSTSQDQTIIVATVAVMALLVGALSARRLRSKSFLASCIENETLEDDMAYDSAYTTTGAAGADSSYNTFGGWKGDLEKFDV